MRISQSQAQQTLVIVSAITALNIFAFGFRKETAAQVFFLLILVRQMTNKIAGLQLPSERPTLGTR